MLLQVYKLLASNTPTTLKTSSAPEVSDPEMVAHQQAQLLSLASRTMALPLGRGALTLGQSLLPENMVLEHVLC